MQTNANTTKNTMSNATQAVANLQFTKQSFMGIELDILVGHPEHDILFIATQVARAAGLKDPNNAVGNFKNVRACNMRLNLREIVSMDILQGDIPKAPNQRTYHLTTSLFDYENTFRMLLRGNAPQSEPFRKWVTAEVLPALVEKGSYNVNESTTKEGMQFSGELAALHAKINSNRQGHGDTLRSPAWVSA